MRRFGLSGITKLWFSQWIETTGWIVRKEVQRGTRVKIFRRRRGYSLVELSFVLIIMLVLAGIVSGGGAFMANQAKAQKVAEKAVSFSSPPITSMPRPTRSPCRPMAIRQPWTT